MSTNQILQLREQSGEHMYLWRRFVLALVGYVTAFLAIASFATSASPFLPQIAMRSVLIGAAVACTFFYYILTWRYQTKSRHSNNHPVAAPGINRTIECANVFSSSMDSTRATNFANIIAYPTQVIERITESIEPINRSIRISSSYTFSLKEANVPNETFVVVTELINRGNLIDGLKFHDSENRRLSSLSRPRAAGYTIAAIRYLLGQAGGSALSEFSSSASGDSLEVKLVRCLVSTSAMPTADIVALTDLFALLDVDPGRRQIIVAIIRMIRQLAVFYPLMVEMQNSGDKLGDLVSIRANTTYRVIPDRYFTKIFLGRPIVPGKRVTGEWLAGLPRRLLGIQPTIIGHPLVNARRSDSYHIEIRGPEGTYLGRQRVIRRSNAEEVNLQSIEYSMRQRMGQRHAHLYLHNAPDLLDGYFECNFFERMPGSVGRSGISALASFILVLIATLDHLGFTNLGKTDILAVLLALPAVAGTWIGIEADRGGISGITVAARVSSIITFTVSLLTAFTYSILPSYHGPENTEFYARPWGWMWALTLGFSAFNFVAICSCWAFRSFIQAHLTGRVGKRS